MKAAFRKPEDLSFKYRTCDDGRKVVLALKAKLDCFPKGAPGFALLLVLDDGFEVIGEAATTTEANLIQQRRIWCAPTSPKV